MNRVAFTIILNGVHHIQHNNYYKLLAENLDTWVIVEGVSLNTGSTSWCNSLPITLHKNFLSNDDTTEFLNTLESTHSNVKIIRCNNKPWSNKDEQVNAAINFIKTKYKECFLWQIDIDEQWTSEQLESAENDLTQNNGKTGCFLCNYLVGPNQVVYGEWGEGRIDPYRRLWRWSGESFLTHEPPKLKGNNGPGLLLPQRFNHFAYCFEKDVLFKQAYYGGYEGLHERWKTVQNNRGTISVRDLLGDKIWWSNTNTVIKYIP